MSSGILKDFYVKGKPVSQVNDDTPMMSAVKKKRKQGS